MWSRSRRKEKKEQKKREEEERQQKERERAQQELFEKHPELAGYCKRLQQNDSSLTEIDLNGKNIDDEVVKKLASALQANSTLKTLNLWGNNIGKEGAASLASALESNSTLETLDLYSNKIGHEGATSLASALEANSTLKTLDLDSNNIGNDGATSLASTLQANSTLERLNLYGNKIGDNGAKKLLEALQHYNGTLTYLNLVKNNISSSIMKQIKSLVEQNKYGIRSPKPIPRPQQEEQARQKQELKERRRQEQAEQERIRLAKEQDDAKKRVDSILNDKQALDQLAVLLSNVNGVSASIASVENIVERLGDDMDQFVALVTDLRKCNIAPMVEGYEQELKELLQGQRASNEDQAERLAIQQSKTDYDFYLHVQWKLSSLIRASECIASGMVEQKDSFQDHLVALITSEGFVEALEKIHFIKTVSAAVQSVMRECESIPGMHAARKVLEFLTKFQDERKEKMAVARVALFSTLVQIRNGPNGGINLLVERAACLLVRCNARRALYCESGSKWQLVKGIALNAIGDIASSSSGQEASKVATKLYRIVMKPPKGSIFKIVCEDPTSTVPLHVALVATFLHPLSVEDICRSNVSVFKTAKTMKRLQTCLPRRQM